MITTILFDVGNVLLTFKPEEYYCQRLEPNSCRRLMTLIFNAPIWHDYDQGLITENALKESIIQKAPDLRQEIELIFSTHMNLFHPVEPLCSLAMELKKSCRISILSNMSENSEKYILEHFDFLNSFEMPLYSWRVKRIKPDPEIFKIQLERLHVCPKEVLFVDDTLRNIETAKTLGLHTVHVTDAAKAALEIQQTLSLQR